TIKKPPILWRTAFQAAVSYSGLSWHTSSVGVPGYSWYCLPGSRVLIMSYEEGSEEKGAAMCSPFMVNSMMSYQ
ncbi:MAG: leishmanolysin, partial [Paraprevotella sp.]|nr:leishmanolysin [Paraprevotella sp.]